MELADVIGGVSGAYIQNQEAGAQTANYWIDGDGTVEGNFTAGNIVGQGSMSSGVASPVGISSPTTPVELASLTYSGYGPGSTIHLSFTGTFDDRGGQDGAYVLVELVRDPGASETVISTSQISIYSPVVYQLQSVAINGVDTPPAGSHTYVIRASVVRSPYTSGRCLNGVFKLAEIKE